MPVDNPNVGIAFALVIGAGAATALGAAVVFFPSLVKLASRRVLASALGISAGVMTYVSFVEIFNKSRLSYIDAGHTEERAYIYATLTFFGGVLIMLVVDLVVRCLSGDHHHDHHHGHGVFHDAHDACPDEEKEDASNEPDVVVPHCVGCSDDPVGELEEWQQRAEEEERMRMQDKTVGSNNSSRPASDEANSDDDIFDDNDQGEGLEAGNAKDSEATSKKSDSPNESHDAGTGLQRTEKTVDMTNMENKKLVRMGINTALAIGIHNFPEGLATFVAALDDPGVGAVLAIAIGIHNIPEGLCVALPIYYATGNRWKAFGWACISGLSEPIAALLGWAVLANTMSHDLYAILFGLVAGMMVIISTKELLPTAHRYDPEDSVVTYSLIGGMIIMALSLVLFVI